MPPSSSTPLRIKQNAIPQRRQNESRTNDNRYGIDVLGTVAQLRGDYDAALDWYRKSLAIAEQLGDRAGMAASYHQLGIVAQLRGDYDAELGWYRKSLAIAEQLGDRAGMATSYHQLGIVAQLRGDYDAALDWYRKSLAIKEQIGNRAGAWRNLMVRWALFCWNLAKRKRPCLPHCEASAFMLS